MLSDEDTQFLNRVLTEIPAHGNVTDYRFFEPEMDEFLHQAGVDETTLSSNWRSFFKSVDQEVCTSCRASVSECTCSDQNHVSTVYFIDPDYVFREWAARIEDHNWFTEITTESIDNLNKRLIAESDSVGTIIFRIFFDGQRFENHSPDPLKPRLSVGFVNGKHADEEEYAYFWTEFIDVGFWKGLHNQLVQLQNPLSLRLCRKETAAVEINAESIEDELKNYFQGVGWDVSEQPQLVCHEVDDYIDIEDVNFVASENENSRALLCECDSDPEHWHFHYFTDGKLSDVTSSEVIETSRDRMRGNVNDYNNLSESRQDLGPFVRIFAVIIGVINIGPLAQFFEILEVDLTTQQTVGILIGIIVVNLILVLALVYLALWPVYRHRTFDWSI
ncbi:hypothetical protein [Halorubrum vacuolatum]|uniref:Uncharacterized protein n=1 Tax=Halorubrum vacuolatum TaxID=63740 RepID=A0A238XE09_HALVU|nr:hypothetical protein [Halorubrum vacuolatum]SNR56574.1 hypothetical protein SAMN06264855_1164 [Halorubrum vacuolatum]